jgi:hypothetical protein
MKKTIIAGAALFTVSLLQADVGLLAALPWIGDGLPDRNGADWYDNLKRDIGVILDNLRKAHE